MSKLKTKDEKLYHAYWLLRVFDFEIDKNHLTLFEACCKFEISQIAIQYLKDPKTIKNKNDEILKNNDVFFIKFFNKMIRIIP